MPKKTKKEKKSEQNKQKSNTLHLSDSEDGTDSVSVSSEQAENEQDWEDQLVAAIEDDLTNKRATTREAALKKITKIMAHQYAAETLEKHWSALLDRVLNSLSKGDQLESLLAAKLLGVILLTIGERTDVYSPEITKRIEQTLEVRSLDGRIGVTTTSTAASFIESYDEDQSTSDDEEQEEEEAEEENEEENEEEEEEVEEEEQTKKHKVVHGESQRRSATVETLCLWYFIQMTPEDLLIQGGILDQIRTKYWVDVDANVVIASLRGFALLLLMLSDSQRAALLNSAAIKQDLLTLISSKYIDLKVAAGQVFAMLYAAFKAEADEGDVLDETVQKIIDNVKIMLRSSYKQHSKRKLASQKGTFRDYLKTIETGEEPVEKLVVRRHPLEFHGWDNIILFDRIKERVGSGIIDHFQKNPFVRTVLKIEEFHFDEKKTTKLNKEEKKMYLSKNSGFNRMETIDKAKKTRQFSAVFENEM